MAALRFPTTAEYASWCRARGLTPQLGNMPAQAKKPEPHPHATEHQEQVALIQWARMYMKIIPQLGLLFAIPNGELRHPVVAKRLKAEGVQSGIPDLCLPVARGAWHGLYIEMKAISGKVSASQEYWHGLLIVEGYHVAVCYGWESAREAILAYLRT